MGCRRLAWRGAWILPDENLKWKMTKSHQERSNMTKTWSRTDLKHKSATRKRLHIREEPATSFGTSKQRKQCVRDPLKPADTWRHVLPAIRLRSWQRAALQNMKQNQPEGEMTESDGAESPDDKRHTQTDPSFLMRWCSRSLSGSPLKWNFKERHRVKVMFSLSDLFVSVIIQVKYWWIVLSRWVGRVCLALCCSELQWWQRQVKYPKTEHKLKWLYFKNDIGQLKSKKTACKSKKYCKKVTGKRKVLENRIIVWIWSSSYLKTTESIKENIFINVRFLELLKQRVEFKLFGQKQKHLPIYTVFPLMYELNDRSLI